MAEVEYEDAPPSEQAAMQATAVGAALRGGARWIEGDGGGKAAKKED